MCEAECGCKVEWWGGQGNTSDMKLEAAAAKQEPKRRDRAENQGEKEEMNKNHENHENVISSLYANYKMILKSNCKEIAEMVQKVMSHSRSVKLEVSLNYWENPPPPSET